MIDLEKEREAFEATRKGEFHNVTFEINDFWKEGHYKGRTSHHDDLDDAHVLSNAWFSWLDRAEIVQKEIESLKAQLEAKNNAIIFTDDCRIEWYELAMRKHIELQEVKTQLAQYQSDDWISVNDRLPEDGQDVVAITSIISCQFVDKEFLEEFYEYDTGHSYQEATHVTSDKTGEERCLIFTLVRKLN